MPEAAPIAEKAAKVVHNLKEKKEKGDDMHDPYLKSAIDRILKLREERASVDADIKSIYDAAADKGYDRKALKMVVKLKGPNTMSDELKQCVNHMLQATDELPLFSFVSH